MLGKKVACVTVSPHLYIHTGVVLAVAREQHFDFGDFINGACHVIKISKADSIIFTWAPHNNHFALAQHSDSWNI